MAVIRVGEGMATKEVEVVDMAVTREGATDSKVEVEATDNRAVKEATATKEEEVATAIKVRLTLCPTRSS